VSRAPTDPRTGAALRPVVSEVVERAGFVLDDLQVRPAGRSHLVRVTVDTRDVPGPDDPPAGGVDLDAVAAVSREVSAVVDAHEESAGAVLDGAWTLEVSTPGTDRPLTRSHHWRRAWLRRVVATLRDGSEVTGRVGAVTDETSAAGAAVTLAVGVGLRHLALDDVARAVVQVEFKPPPDAEVAALRAARTGAGQAAPDAGPPPAGEVAP